MSYFDKLYNSIQSQMNPLGESVLDIPRNSLDPTVFQFPDDGQPILQPTIKTQILSDINVINEVVPVQNFYIIGSILSKNYNANSDIDVNVEIVEETEDFDLANAHALLRQMNGRMATGTTHPINYYVLRGEYNIDKTSAAYDVGSETWLKEPEEVDINVTSYFDKFKDTIRSVDLSISSLRRNIIDFDEILSLDKSQLSQLDGLLKVKLEEIEHDVNFLIKAYLDTADARREAFNRDMSPEEIVQYGKKYKLPENVIYKMLEKYYYSTFIKKLKHIIGDDQELDDEDIEDIKKASNEFFSFESYIEEKVGKSRRKRPKQWKDPLNRHEMKISRGLDRKTQKQVSDAHSSSLPKIYANLKHKPLMLAKDAVDRAKKTDVGIWRVPKEHVSEIAQFYDVKIPNNYDKAKILGKTKIILWYKKPNHYYLVKNKAKYHDKTK